MGRGGTLLVQGLRKMRPKKTNAIDLPKTNRENERIHCCAPHNLLRGGRRWQALALHQVLQKRDLRLHSQMTAAHTQLAQCKV